MAEGACNMYRKFKISLKNIPISQNLFFDYNQLVYLKE
ncbi:hypothetical protein KIS4809_5644 [Bacillus sp. ZZV12-4809]|nr:hypothetical protein KIS4809_5644 [Bacillus sp. ZZV12-4809]